MKSLTNVFFDFGWLVATPAASKQHKKIFFLATSTLLQVPVPVPVLKIQVPVQVLVLCMQVQVPVPVPSRTRLVYWCRSTTKIASWTTRAVGQGKASVVLGSICSVYIRSICHDTKHLSSKASCPHSIGQYRRCMRCIRNHKSAGLSLTHCAAVGRCWYALWYIFHHFISIRFSHEPKRNVIRCDILLSTDRRYYLRPMHGPIHLALGMHAKHDIQLVDKRDSSVFFYNTYVVMLYKNCYWFVYKLRSDNF